MNLSMLLSSLLFLLASGLFVGVIVQMRRRARQVVQRLDGKAPSENRFSQWLHALGTSRVGQQSVKLVYALVREGGVWLVDGITADKGV